MYYLCVLPFKNPIMETENSFTENTEEMVRFLSEPLYSGKGWIKFFGIMNILYGIFAAITLVGIVFAWIPIWLGILVNGAANQVEKAYIVGDKYALLEAQKKLRTYFVIQAVLVLAGLIIVVAFLVIAMTTGIYSEMWDKMHSEGIY
jgi:hypothetical protein